MGDLSEDEMAAAVAYSEGHMTEAEQLQFEIRLQSHPSLAEAVEGLVDGYPILASLGGRDGSDEGKTDTRSDRDVGWVGATLTAAALVLVVVRLVSWAPLPGERSREIRVAVRPTPKDAETYSAGFPSWSYETIPWGTQLRSGGEEPEVSEVKAAEFLAEAEERLRFERQAALLAADEEVRGAFYRVDIELPFDAAVVICAVGSPFAEDPDSDKRSCRLLFPAERESVLGRLSAGTHTFPSEAVHYLLDGNDNPVDLGRVEFEMGYVRPISERSTEIMIGCRSEPLDEMVLAEIRVACEEGREALVECLLGLGFRTMTRHVTE